MPYDAMVLDVLKQLDEGDFDVSTWEAGFLDSLLRQTYPLKRKQREVLAQMCERYLPASGLAAELRGQQRLFG
jgi:hypothetical protein